MTCEIFTIHKSLKKMSDQENLLILHLMMKVFCESVEKYVFLMWKWKSVTMDFVVGLSRSRDRYDSIWVIVDRLTKPAHFLPVKSTYYVAELYVKLIVCLHGVPISIASDRGSVFTSRFSKKKFAGSNGHQT